MDDDQKVDINICPYFLEFSELYPREFENKIRRPHPEDKVK